MDELDAAIETTRAELDAVRHRIQARIEHLTERLLSVRALFEAFDDEAKQLAEELKDLRAKEAALTLSRR